MTLCEKATTVIKDDDGKEEKREDNIYLTQYERLDGNSGIVQAAVHQVEGQDKQFFMVAIPLDIQIKPGLRVSIYPKDQWELVQKNDKIDETKLKGIKLGYTVCYPAGCAAGVEATGELLNDLRTSGGFVVSATNSAGAPVDFVVPLVGFAEALAFRCQPAQRPLVCASAEWAKAEWRGCSVKPIQEWEG